jgi:uncharacterized membrane protein
VNKLRGVIFIFFLVFILSAFVTSARAYAEEINSFDVEIQINTNGTINVKEKVDYNFAEPRHGIVRSIPFTKTNNENKKFVMAVDNINVTDTAGTDVPFSATKNSDKFSLKIGDAEKTVTGRHTYVINYRVSGALTYFNDHDELYWNVTGNEWEVPIRSVRSQIRIPSVLNQDQISSSCYTGSRGSTQSLCTTQFAINRTTTTVTTQAQGLNSGEGMTVAVLYPKGITAILEPAPYRIGFVEVLKWVASAIWYGIVPLIFLGYFFRIIKKERTAKVVSAWFDPPRHADGTNFLPAETSVLLDGRVDEKDFSATIIQLAQKGYLKIVEKEKKFELHILNRDYSALFPSEKFLMETLDTRSVNNIVAVDKLSKNIAFGKNVLKFYEKVKKELQNKGVIKKSTEWLPYLLLFAGLFGFFNIPLVIVGVLLMIKGLEKTDLGYEQYGVAKSLKNFLVSQEEQLNFQAENQFMFEKLLPFATAFGVEEKWAKRFANITLAQPDWYEGSNFNGATISSFSHAFATSSKGAVTSAGSSSSSGFSSGGGGGGFSGGGGGGGGGGSW